MNLKRLVIIARLHLKEDIISDNISINILLLKTFIKKAPRDSLLQKPDYTRLFIKLINLKDNYKEFLI